VERMRAAIVDARAVARGHEAVLVGHQAPIWLIRRATEGRSLVHHPARRECALASLTTLTFIDDELLSLSYSAPAAALLSQAQPGAGA
ncbi:MAG: histidine phosphatase family protein, partial [Phycicoccus sp.]